MHGRDTHAMSNLPSFLRRVLGPRAWRGLRGGRVGRSRMAAAAQSAKRHDFSARDARERAIHIIHVVAADGRLVGALRERGLEREGRGGEIGDERVLPAAAESVRQRGLSSACGGMLQLVENLVERAIHQVHERVRVGEGGVDRSRAQARRPLGMEGGAVG